MFGNLLQQLQSGYKASPMQAPAALPTQMPSTQHNLGLMNQLGRMAGGTPNYTGLFGAMGMQPSTAIPNTQTMLGQVQAPATPQPTELGLLQQQLAQLGLMYPARNFFGSPIEGQYWTPQQYDNWWQSQRDGGQ